MLRFTLILSLLLAASNAQAQARKPSHCIALSQAPGVEYVVPAAYGASLAEQSVRISYVDHSTFAIETPGGLLAATDYTGFLGTTERIPDVVTMNNAHDTHWTAFPDQRIPHVLEGWTQNGVAADHFVDLGEMLVRNVPTDVRSGFGDVRKNGNSIFVFEVAGLCVGHLGHLHHEPDAAQYAALGRVDVVMAPVDGGRTLDLPSMIRVMKRLKSSVVLPMHWFGRSTLETFLIGMDEEFDVVRTDENWIELSLQDLPRRPTVIVLEPRYLRDPE
ncbi:MBL fold metallo-hydrolase [Actibacterium pelagium]|uniref:Zn-dependent hydrolase n=1 Tax=Actibacterium pelagium TaxID=2029103 RepID=A0A917AFX4_9RHOB|nr:MBL fold metallo-hydrolase [Actibacterium pelagium]GGE50596.1 Zn-dependent hydrolase [Actibacterium pelagium]